MIANRGEIAVRIIRACQELGIETVAVYSQADKEALHVLLADEAYCIGPAKTTESYLNMQQLLSVAMVSGAQGIHPGFGFLSENAQFAEMCEECGLIFIGPTSQTIRDLGDKVAARQIMIQHNVPVIPGSDQGIYTLEEAQKIAREIDFPIMLKAASGGGGKGIRRLNNLAELTEQFNSAQKESLAAFGDTTMYIEKIIDPAKHIEVQILGDQLGHVIHLGERDCSLQRNNQKVMEETPSPTLDEKTRSAICQTALTAAQAVAYQNAGTIEFLMDESGEFYFMEMNTRIQVEHPITEMVTGVDIVKEQLQIAYGYPLSYQQEDINITGHSIECRLNAENPAQQFAPCPGKINQLMLPSGGLGLRVDSGMYEGYQIPPFYDSMIAKVIVHGRDRSEALNKMQRALAEFSVEGIETNQEFQFDLVSHPDVVAGNYNTRFIQEVFLSEWLSESK